MKVVGSHIYIYTQRTIGETPAPSVYIYICISIWYFVALHHSFDGRKIQLLNMTKLCFQCQHFNPSVPTYEHEWTKPYPWNKFGNKFPCYLGTKTIVTLHVLSLTSIVILMLIMIIMYVSGIFKHFPDIFFCTSTCRCQNGSNSPTLRV